jgi:hypothetical protein
MIALRFDVGVDHLIVEKLRGLRPAGNTPVVIIQQAAEKPELVLLIQNLDLHEIRKLLKRWRPRRDLNPRLRRERRMA